MWTLLKPDITKAVGLDIDVLEAHCTGLSNTDKPLLRDLYQNYDNGNGSVSNAQLAPLANKGAIILSQYKKTYGSDHLSYIREELNKNVHKCPMCGINDPNTLDHYMDKSSYGQLACCRLNLVPVCGECNGKKSDIPFGKFVHAYYDRYPSVPFLIANVDIVNGAIVFDFYIDNNAIANSDLANKTEFQFKQMDLKERLRQSVNNYLDEEIRRLFCDSNECLQHCLRSLYDVNKRRFGLNHWKTAIIKGLIDCKNFNIDVVNNIRQSSMQIENGIGA